MNPKTHARALQAGSKLTGAYDARSLCHGVVVGFEKSKGNLFGLSNEPFLSKPARHKEHDGKNLQLKNRVLAARLHEALEAANHASPNEVFASLVRILRLGAKRSTENKVAAIVQRVNLRSTIQFIRELLRETDGGARLVGVWGALTQLLSERAEVKVYAPSASDFFGKTSGDVETFYELKLISSSECKQRPTTLDDVSHGIKKARGHGLAEYLFVHSAGLAAGQEKAIDDLIQTSLSSLDVAIIDIQREAETLVKALNPERRAQFGETVVALLRTMRKFESANKAAELCNTLTS